jgi:hypothetical protein
MITEVELKITLQLDHDAPITDDKMKLAAKQAVTNALKREEDMGFAHDLADDVSIGVADVEITSINTGCVRCGSDLDADCTCVDCTCPFSDHDQNCPAGWQGHPEHKSGPCNCKGKP